MQNDTPSMLVIANPAAGNNTGTQTARSVIAELEDAIAKGRTSPFLADVEVEAAFLGSAEQSRLLMENAAGKRAVMVVGGDGLVHLAVNALMKVDAESRPALAVIPAGTGNDYARALGLPLDFRKATRRVLKAAPRAVDLGLCNGEFFAETLSFGLDAAIALDTVERRERTGRKDAGVYFSSGIDQLMHNLRAHSYHAVFDGKAVDGECVTFAVQVGPYYGGGFKICPEAELDDGMLDLCISHPPVSVPRAIYIFVRAKNGKHVKMKLMEFERVHNATIEFDEEPPCQIDGEPLHAKRFDISCVPGVLNVLA